MQIYRGVGHGCAAVQTAIFGLVVCGRCFQSDGAVAYSARVASSATQKFL